MKFLIPDQSGHKTVEFDETDPRELERAAKMFDELVKGEKKTAYKRKAGQAPSVTRELDPTADETVFISPLAGG